MPFWILLYFFQFERLGPNILWLSSQLSIFFEDFEKHHKESIKNGVVGTSGNINPIYPNRTKNKPEKKYNFFNIEFLINKFASALNT